MNLVARKSGKGFNRIRPPCIGSAESADERRDGGLLTMLIYANRKPMESQLWDLTFYI